MDRKYYVEGATPYLSNILWERSSVWLERMPVTHEVASSSLVVPAIKREPFMGSFLYFVNIVLYQGF